MVKRKEKKPLWMRLLICAGALGAVVLALLLIEMGIDRSGAVEKAEAKQEERIAKRNEKNALDATLTETAETESAEVATEEPAEAATEAATELSFPTVTEEGSTDPEGNVTSIALTNPQLDVTAYDPTLVEWGSGGPTDAYGRPDGCMIYQKKYGDLSAYFIMPWEEGEPKKVYLTFDIGYTNEYTVQILDTLKEKGVKGVFFATLPVVQEDKEICQRIINEGHELGNHSVTHTNIVAKSIEEQQKELMDVHNAAVENYGYVMHLWRYPEGKFSQQGLAIVNNCNYRSVFWSFAHRDWVVDAQPDVNETRTKVINALHPGAIYLLHGISASNAAVLGDLIDAGLEQGYTFELLQ